MSLVTSEIFPERMISVVNLLFGVYHILLDQDNIGKMIFLRMGKMLMERVRRKEVFTSVMFHGVLSNEHTITNEVK